MNSDTIKFFSLSAELETSHNLLVAGFGALQEIDMGNTFYHLPHQLMASGLERLAGAYPDKKVMKGLGHDLTSLLDEICERHFGETSRPLVRADHDFLATDRVARECIRILSLFGRFGRYYNLDIVAGSDNDPVDPAAEWEALETEAVDPTPYLGLSTGCTATTTRGSTPTSLRRWSGLSGQSQCSSPSVNIRIRMVSSEGSLTATQLSETSKTPNSARPTTGAHRHCTRTWRAEVTPGIYPQQVERGEGVKSSDTTNAGDRALPVCWRRKT